LTDTIRLRIDYTLNNPDTLTKYKTAAQISEKVLATVSSWIEPGAKIVELCQKGDKLIEEEVAKVYRGKKVTKGMHSGVAHSYTCST
jgi:methionine aminopeptidase